MDFRKADLKDIELIVNTRVMLIDEDSGLNENEKKNLYESNKAYMHDAMKQETFISFLAFDGDIFVGTASACLYAVLPGKKLPKGKNAYIQNVYVLPSYRRNGIGKKLISMVDIQVTNLPGIKFAYSEWNPPLICEIILKACGMNEWHMCYEYLYKPLGITNPKWDEWLLSYNPSNISPHDVVDKKYSLYTICSHDLAKIGLLILHGGVWNGHRVISEEYIKASLSPSNANSGYGYFWWLEDNRYLGLGWGGQ